MSENASLSRGRGWLWLLLLPFAGVLWGPFYIYGLPWIAS
ncbi:hypothetical protein PTE31013_04012 [Pandoraea terrigena]|uniref:Uncharacterized protein n=1 Tax=Pandoraea terrigena TaxID=2508292 RepID=A0A5E4XNC9_9BURK|nr:hypothetical protein PTE31013_04012 [Pandoraea terrigena]